jgi:hypothetical protein
MAGHHFSLFSLPYLCPDFHTGKQVENLPGSKLVFSTCLDSYWGRAHSIRLHNIQEIASSMKKLFFQPLNLTIFAPCKFSWICRQNGGYSSVG